MSFASSKGLGTCFTAWALPKLKDKVKTLLFLFQQGVASAELKSFAASETEVCGAKKAGRSLETGETCSLRVGLGASLR
jgi:hypothetical protein